MPRPANGGLAYVCVQYQGGLGNREDLCDRGSPVIRRKSPQSPTKQDTLGNWMSSNQDGLRRTTGQGL